MQSVPENRPGLVAKAALSPENRTTPWVCGFSAPSRFATKPNKNWTRFDEFWYFDLQTFPELAVEAGNSVKMAYKSRENSPQCLFGTRSDFQFPWPDLLGLLFRTPPILMNFELAQHPSRLSSENSSKTPENGTKPHPNPPTNYLSPLTLQLYPPDFDG